MQRQHRMSRILMVWRRTEQTPQQQQTTQQQRPPQQQRPSRARVPCAQAPPLSLVRILVIALCLSFALMGTVLAAGQQGSITLKLQDGTTGLYMTDGVISLYKVANIRQTGTDVYEYIYTSHYAGMEAQGELTTDTFRTMITPLYDYTRDNDISPTASQTPNEKGKVVFGDLETGLYLVVQDQSADGFVDIDPFLVSVPMDMGDGLAYDIDATPKTEVSGSGDNSGSDRDTTNPGEGENIPVSPATGEDQTPLIIISLVFFGGACVLLEVARSKRDRRNE